MKTSTTVTIINAMRAATASHSCARCTLPAILKRPSRMPTSKLFCVGREELLRRFSLAFEIGDRLVDDGLRQLLHLRHVGGRQGYDLQTLFRRFEITREFLLGLVGRSEAHAAGDTGLLVDDGAQISR